MAVVVGAPLGSGTGTPTGGEVISRTRSRTGYQPVATEFFLPGHVGFDGSGGTFTGQLLFCIGTMGWQGRWRGGGGRATPGSHLRARGGESRWRRGGPGRATPGSHWRARGG